MSIFDLVNELAAILEPTASKRDDTVARPVVYAPDMLYAWPRSERFDAIDTGGTDEEHFAVRVAWAADESMEIAEAIRSRTVSQAIDSKVAVLRAAIAGHRAGTNFEWVQVDGVDYESLITNDARGFLMDLSGYKLLS